MARNNRFSNIRQKSRARTAQATTREAPPVIEKKPPTVYGKPFILMEDENRNTFDYKGGKWIPHAMTIAECRLTCLVKELPQKVKNMTRYEIQSPLA
jgi:hypothetical protein